MKVEVIKDHGNGHGDKWEKAKGDTYDLPDAQAETLIAEKLVVRAGKKSAEAPKG